MCSQRLACIGLNTPEALPLPHAATPPLAESVASRIVSSQPALPGAGRPFTCHMAVELIMCYNRRLERRLGDSVPGVELLKKKEVTQLCH